MRPLAVSMGDPAGIGLELIARIAAEGGAPPFFLIADPGAFSRAAARAGVSAPAFTLIGKAEDAREGEFSLLSQPLAMAEEPGAPDPVNADPIQDAIRRGVEACLSGGASALVTLPIAKAALYGGGFGFPGHTEFIGDLTKDIPWPHARGPVMVIASKALKVALATIHTPLAAVPSQITRARILHVGRVVHEALLRDFGIEKPRIALCGLNPHAGESGELGREEIDIINPAAALLRTEGLDISDARPADTLFHPEARAGYDAAIAMYHDQGLVAAKTIDIWGGVNVTIGLPIIRTSPDHGTAFDLVGKGMAKTDSVRAALDLAWEMAKRRAA